MPWVVGTIRFVTEIALWIGAGYVGWTLVSGWPRWVLAALIVLVILLVWGRWIAPRAPRRLPDPPRLIFELALFVGVGVLLIVFGQLWWGLGVAVVGGAFAIIARRVPPPGPSPS